MEKKLCSSAQSYWRISKLTFSLVLLISLCTPLLPAQATTTNANQIQAVDLLQIPVAQSLRLDQIILDGETSPASLKLERFEVFAPDVQIVVHDGQGHEQIQSRPASAYFKGEIAGAPHSLVVLSADPDGTMRGIAQLRGKALDSGRRHCGRGAPFRASESRSGSERRVNGITSLSVWC